MKRFFAPIAVIAAVAGFSLINFNSPARLETSRTVVLKGATLHVAVADTEAAREKGLAGVRALRDDEGMLFIFPEDGRWSFWMKDMLIPLDIVWLSAEGRVVFMVQNATPETYPSAFTPDTPARFVLELAAGWIKAHGLALGDVAQL